MQEAGIPRRFAPTIGIAVDSRRRNASQESLTLNVARLKTYKERLILFPRKSGQHKTLDSKPEAIKAVEEGKINRVHKVETVVPIDPMVGLEHGFSEVKRSEMPKGEENAYMKLRIARSDARLVGVREKRAKAKAEEAEAKKGK